MKRTLNIQERKSSFRSRVANNREDVLGVEDLDMERNFEKVNCVCEKVRAIADAQDAVIENCCDVSCKQSIRSLVSPVVANELDTVPFLLYCKGDCKPYKATGFFKDNGNFQCVETFIFRVKSVDDDCCAVLELLAANGGDLPGPEKRENPCRQLDNVDVDDLMATGICITVDLNCFCAITCLPAVSLF